MAFYLKQRFNEYRERKYHEPTFRIYSDASTEVISEPMENSFIHINGTTPNIVDRSKTIVTVRHTQLAEEADCIIVNNSKFYSSVGNMEESDVPIGEEFPDGSRNKDPNQSLNIDLSFRDTILRKPVRGISAEMEDLSLDLDSPDIEFTQSRLTLQKSVAEKYKLGDLVEEMDGSFFEMTDEEKRFRDAKRSENESINGSNNIKQSIGSNDDPVRGLRTPPPPPKPTRKNSQKRIQQVDTNEKESEDNSDMDSQ